MDEKCYAYQYKVYHARNCFLIYMNSTVADGLIFKQDSANTLYEIGLSLTIPTHEFI